MIYCAATIFGLIALMLEKFSPAISLVIASATAVAALAGIFLMELAPYERQQKKSPGK